MQTVDHRNIDSQIDAIEQSLDYNHGAETAGPVNDSFEDKVASTFRRVDALLAALRGELSGLLYSRDVASQTAVLVPPILYYSVLDVVDNSNLSIRVDLTAVPEEHAKQVAYTIAEAHRAAAYLHVSNLGQQLWTLMELLKAPDQVPADTQPGPDQAGANVEQS